MFEDHRFFDERRWKLFDNQTASSETNLPRYKQVYNLYGVIITPEQSPMYTYGPAERTTLRTFQSPRDYYFPIPDEEIRKLPNLGQNEGW